MKIFKTIFVFVIVLLATNGCVDTYLPPELKVQYNYLVVDGFLNGGSDTTTIKLSHTVTLNDSNVPVPVTGAKVLIEDQRGTAYQLHEDSTGVYRIAPSEMSLSSEIKYRLHIITTSAEYASDYVPLRVSPAIDSVTWKEGGNAIQFSVNTHDPSGNTKYYLWNYKETWKFNSLKLSYFTYKNGIFNRREHPDELYYCYKTTSSLGIYIASSTALSSDQISEFPLLHLTERAPRLYYEYSILVEQQAVTEEAYEYWLTLSKLSNNTGTIFAPLPSKVTGNFHCISNPGEDVLGYFSASVVSTKRLVLNRSQIVGPSGPYPQYDPTGYQNCRETQLLVLNPTPAQMAGFIVVDWIYIDKLQIQVGWDLATEECMDCRYRGSRKKPDFFID